VLVGVNHFRGLLEKGDDACFNAGSVLPGFVVQALLIVLFVLRRRLERRAAPLEPEA